MNNIGYKIGYVLGSLIVVFLLCFMVYCIRNFALMLKGLVVRYMEFRKRKSCRPTGKTDEVSEKTLKEDVADESSVLE